MRNRAVLFCGSAAQATPRAADAKTKEFTVTVDLISDVGRGHQRMVISRA
jgi:hypothetical protein